MVFILSAVWKRIRGLWKVLDARDWLWGKLGLVLMGRAMLSKSPIQFSVDGQGWVPSLLFDLRPNYGGGNEDNGDLLQNVLCMHCHTQCPSPAAGHCQPMPQPETPGHSQTPQPLTVGSPFPSPCLHASATAPCWIMSLDGAAWSGNPARQVELFQILKDDTIKVLHSICYQIWKAQQWPQDWKRSVFIPIPKKANAKECSNDHTIALISHTSKGMLKILQARLQQYVNRELPDVKAAFRKGRRTRDQIANIRCIIEKARKFQKNIYFCFIDYAKAFDSVDHNKLENSSRDGNTNPPYQPPGKSGCKSKWNS